MTVQNLKLRAAVRFPAQVQGSGGLVVSKTNGIWTVKPNFSALSAISGDAVNDPTTKQLWIYDPNSGEYNTLTLAGLGTAMLRLTSTSSLTIGTGSKTFTTQSGKSVSVGDWMLATSNADTSNFMIGQITAYSGTSMTLNVTQSGGSGTHADWTIRASAPTPTGTALTKTDDTNVTLTLGGSAGTALLNAASLTLGWTGQLAVSRGGTGTDTSTGTGSAVLNTEPTINFTQTGTGAAARSLIAQAKEVFTPEQFGAVGDGTTNDTTAIANWLTAANGKNAQATPGKTYLTDPVAISQTNANVPAVLDFRGATLKGRATSTSPTITVENPHAIASNFVLKNLKINANSLHAVGLKVHGSQNATYDNIDVTGATSTGAMIQGEPSYGVYYNTFRRIYSHNNDGSGFYVKSVNNTGGYYIAADTFNTCQSISNGGFGWDIDYATCAWIGTEAENNSSTGVALDHTYSATFVGHYDEGNFAAGGSGKAFAGSANTNGVAIIGGRTIGTIDSFVKGNAGNFINTNDNGGSPVNYLAGIALAQTGIALGGASLAANTISNSADTFVAIGGSNAMTIHGDSWMSSGWTNISINYHNGSIQRLGNVLLGATDSGGTGFRLLKVAN